MIYFLTIVVGKPRTTDSVNHFRRVCVCVCVCLCVCVSVCVFILFHREGFFRLQDVDTCLRGTDQRCYVVSIIRCASAKFLHLSIRKCHISPPKTKLQEATNWRENECDINCPLRKDDILI